MLWGRQAELAQRHLAKGSMIYVDGALQTREWTDRSGNKRSMTEIRARRFQFLGGRSDASPERGATETAAPAAEES